MNQDTFATKFTRPEIEARYRRDLFFRVAVDVGYKMKLDPWMMHALQNVLPFVVLEGRTEEEREEELRKEAFEMVRYHLGEVGKIYSLPS